MGSTFRMKSAHQADLKGKGILYEDDDEPVKLIDRDDSFVIKEFGLTLIGKILNPKKQNVEKLLQTMPSQWGLAERITANDLGNGKFLFNFTNVEDLNYVMAKGPFHFNFCMFVLVRWEPIVHDDYPWIIPFWVHLIGFPLHLWTDANLRNIGGRIGHIDTMELTEGRMLIDVDSRRPLKFSRKVEYEGDEVTIEIKYDLLFKHCTTCGMLSHEKGYCPSIGARQPTLERADVFTRMQLPVRHNGRDNQSNVRRHHQPSLEIREPYSRTYAEYMPRCDLGTNLREGNDRQSRSWDDNCRLGSHADRRMGTHADRIIRRRDDYKRSDRYGGGRARAGPYDRSKEVSWRPKQRLPEVNGKEQRGDASNNEIVPYEHISGAGSLDSSTHFKDADVMLGVFKAPKTNAVRPQPVAPTSRSRLRERPRCVAARGRSGFVLASPGDENASDFFLSLWYGRSKLRERLQHVALEGRSELVLASPGDENASDFFLSLWYGRSKLWERLQHVALEGRSEVDLMPSLREVAPAVLVQSHSNHLLLSSKCTQMSPETPCGAQLPDRDICMQNAT
ncbi:hypothetical protein IGI04_035720 [Brassica rapa subsp. trilocularis]|uniref:DUF4283 domain-containing protein n=1 Tax=Brassica rapa subsp. trilocularis TaxID=1813537 RepID=A0ABQ7LF61_BRACM|nr:hypothetical protein IGI04_035720 [Brassica rapa subsp. trilocularis]